MTTEIPVANFGYSPTYLYDGQPLDDYNAGVGMSLGDLDASAVSIPIMHGAEMPSGALEAIMLYCPCVPCRVFSRVPFAGQVLDAGENYGPALDKIGQEALSQAVPVSSVAAISNSIRVAEHNHWDVSHAYPYHGSDAASIPNFHQYTTDVSPHQGFHLDGTPIYTPRTEPTYVMELSPSERALSPLQAHAISCHPIPKSTCLENQNENPAPVIYTPKPMRYYQHTLDFRQRSTNATPQAGSNSTHNSEVQQPVVVSTADAVSKEDRTKHTDPFRSGPLPSPIAPTSPCQFCLPYTLRRL